MKPGGQVVVAGFFVGKDCKEAHDFVKGFGWPPIPTPAVFAEVSNTEIQIASSVVFVSYNYN